MNSIRKNDILSPLRILCILQNFWTKERPCYVMLNLFLFKVTHPFWQFCCRPFFIWWPFRPYTKNFRRIQTCIFLVLYVLSIHIALVKRKTSKGSSSFLLEYLVHVDQFLSVFQCTCLKKVFEYFLRP